MLMPVPVHGLPHANMALVQLSGSAPTAGSSIMSNTTSAVSAPPTSVASTPSTPSSPPASPPTSKSTTPPPPTTSLPPPPPTTSSSTPIPPSSSSSSSSIPAVTTSSSSSTISSTSSTSTTSSTISSTTSTTSSSTSSSSTPFTTKKPATITVTNGGTTSVKVVTQVTTAQDQPTMTTSSTAAGSTATPIDPSGSHAGGLTEKSKVAIGVVVPIAAIALLAVLGLFWWKRRRARRQAEEERRKEVEDYAYNPNADPAIPAAGAATDNMYEMREDGSSGYRGWGTTLAGSTGRKASTTMSGGVAAVAYSDATSPTKGNASDVRSGEPLLDGSESPDGEILGAMGPSAANNRNGEVHRGPSNASSTYSAAGRSDGSDGPAPSYGNGGAYYDQYSQNPYAENAAGGGGGGAPGQPIIRDNPARRNTRIENSSHYPQQSAGISQNF